MEKTTGTKPTVMKTAAPKTAVPTQTAAVKKTNPKSMSSTHAEGAKMAIILVRGMINVKKDIIATMDKFMLRQKLVCVVVPKNEANRYAAIKIKDYVTYGEISEETYKLLVEKRGEKGPDGKVKKFFRMHPPRGGFERKGIKVPFNQGGALGYRGEKMNDLIKRML